MLYSEASPKGSRAIFLVPWDIHLLDLADLIGSQDGPCYLLAFRLTPFCITIFRVIDVVS